MKILEKACPFAFRRWLLLLTCRSIGSPQDLWFQREAWRLRLLQACHLVTEDMSLFYEGWVVRQLCWHPLKVGLLGFSRRCLRPCIGSHVPAPVSTVVVGVEGTVAGNSPTLLLQLITWSLLVKNPFPSWILSLIDALSLLLLELLLNRRKRLFCQPPCQHYVLWVRVLLVSGLLLLTSRWVHLLHSWRWFDRLYPAAWTLNTWLDYSFSPSRWAFRILCTCIIHWHLRKEHHHFLATILSSFLCLVLKSFTCI